MEWYQYLSGFWAGFFLVNTIPHYVSGLQGRKFTTAFASPPGKGLSSPIMNIVWALINLFAGLGLFFAAKITTNNWLSIIVFFIGVTLTSFYLSNRFGKQNRE